MDNPKHKRDASRALERAKEELAAAQEQASEDFARRARALEEIASSLEAGVVSPEAVEGKLKELLAGEKRGRGPRRRAAKVRNKLRMDVQAPGHGGPGFRRGPSRAMVGDSLTRALSLIDHQIVLILSTLRRDPPPGLGLVHLALLTDRRQSVVRSLATLPDDALLLEDVLSFSEELQEEVGQMHQGADFPLVQLVNYLSSIIATEVAMGGASVLKELRVEARTLQRRLRESAESGPPFERELLELWGRSAGLLSERWVELVDTELYRIIFSK